MSEQPEAMSEPPDLARSIGAPTEVQRAVKAAALGAILGTVLALLARAGDRRRS